MSHWPVLFIDRDGTLIVEPPDDKVDSIEKLEFLPGVLDAMGRIASAGLYKLVLVTNQDGLGGPEFPEDQFWPPHERMIHTFRSIGVTFDAVHIDRTYPDEGKSTRKPGTGMLTAYMKGDFNLQKSFVIGDRITDIELARNLGSKGILIGPDVRAIELGNADLLNCCALITTSWDRIAHHVLNIKN